MAQYEVVGMCGYVSPHGQVVRLFPGRVVELDTRTAKKLGPLVKPLTRPREPKTKPEPSTPQPVEAAPLLAQEDSPDGDE